MEGYKTSWISSFTKSKKAVRISLITQEKCSVQWIKRLKSPVAEQKVGLETLVDGHVVHLTFRPETRVCMPSQNN